jgi:hypothetical protein
MKINIGPYITWIGPYQIADLLKHFGVSEDRYHAIGSWLADTWVNDVCQWIYSKKKRKVSIRIDKYDVWSMDGTLAMIIVPMLKQLKQQKHGSPLVDDVDVPETIRSTADPEYKADAPWNSDKFIHDRWDYVMEQMIWSFEQCLSENDPMMLYYGDGKADAEGYKQHQVRIQNGLQLFGKYYQGLWD